MTPKCNVVLRKYTFSAELHGEKTEFCVLAESLAAAKLRLPRDVKKVKLMKEENPNAERE